MDHHLPKPPSLRRSVPSMSALATFEAAARLGSFTQAAVELGVTQAAVSRQIKALEGDLNTQLFLRANRRVALTPQGAALAGTVGQAFASMAEMIEAIRAPVHADTVTIGATLAFSHFWILPRLPDFRAAHPGIKLRLVAEDAALDLRRDRLDVAVRFGRPPFADARSVTSHPEQVFPVCSPGLLARQGLTPSSADWSRLPLISSDVVSPTWLTWQAWAQSVGLGAELGRAARQSLLRFNHYTDTIHAAVHSEGVALGWATLVTSHIAEGRLVRVGPHQLVPEDRYHLLVPAIRDMSPATAAFVDWMEGAFAKHQQAGLEFLHNGVRLVQRQALRHHLPAVGFGPRGSNVGDPACCPQDIARPGRARP